MRLRRIVTVALVALSAGCSHEHRRMGPDEIVAMKGQSVPEDQILRQAQEQDVVLAVTAEDAPVLREAGLSENLINALLGVAFERSQTHPREAPKESPRESPGHRH